MENASKAIIMAGSVLIAMAIISLALYAYWSYSDYAKSSEQLLTASQIASFNRFYDSYQSGAGTDRAVGGIVVTFYEIRGIDYLNIYKKAVEDRNVDESFAISFINENRIAAISSDSNEFTAVNYYCGFEYDSQGKVDTVYLGYNF